MSGRDAAQEAAAKAAGLLFNQAKKAHGQSMMRATRVIVCMFDDRCRTPALFQILCLGCRRWPGREETASCFAI
jgi:hypothetical protein